MQRRRSIAGPDKARHLHQMRDRREGDIMTANVYRRATRPTEPPRSRVALWNPSGVGR